MAIIDLKMNNFTEQYLYNVKTKKLHRDIYISLFRIKHKIDIKLYYNLIENLKKCKENNDINMYIDLNKILKTLNLKKIKKIVPNSITILRKQKKNENLLLKYHNNKENNVRIEKPKKLSLKLEWDYDNPCEK